jgi:hypothetical protein
MEVLILVAENRAKPGAGAGPLRKKAKKCDRTYNHALDASYIRLACSRDGR